MAIKPQKGTKMIIIDDDGIMHKVLPMDTLDKIRAEIDSHCSDNRDRNDGLYIAMKIIDRYRNGVSS